jgi:hypothetical protein
MVDVMLAASGCTPASSSAGKVMKEARACDQQDDVKIERHGAVSDGVKADYNRAPDAPPLR